jgi:hypothetical protein
MSEAEGKREELSAAPITVVMTDFMVLKKGFQVFRK